MMKIGLYHLKYSFRKVIFFLLPFFKKVDPNVVSWSLIPLGIITAITYFFAPHIHWLYLLACGLIFLRMVIGTLDGLMAAEFQKSTAKGEMANRIAPEIADMCLILGIAFSSFYYSTLGLVAITMCWAVTFFGLIGLVANRKIQSVGPVGQTDRIVALIVFSICQYLSLYWAWNFDFIMAFFLWVIIGSVITCALRIYSLFKKKM
ncbi:MAG: Inner membrane protein YnbA [Candidatus Anoxychlamydiales bacterium]|nr:Inner membrane protein YnbA [Candidatus Anoxychlamydiales bacterium]